MTTTQTAPATEKQINFLTSLVTERGVTPPSYDNLGKAEASQMISNLLKLPKVAPKPGTPDVPSGHYAIESTGHNDLAFYRVDKVTEGKWAGRTFVKLVIGGRPDARIPFRQVAGILERIANDPDSGPRYGREIGRCYACNRHLTDEVSRSLGIGPECRKKGH